MQTHFLNPLWGVNFAQSLKKKCCSTYFRYLAIHASMLVSMILTQLTYEYCAWYNQVVKNRVTTVDKNKYEEERTFKECEKTVPTINAEREQKLKQIFRFPVFSRPQLLAIPVFTIRNIMRNGRRHNEHKFTMLLACRLHSPKLSNRLTHSPAWKPSFCLRWSYANYSIMQIDSWKNLHKY